LYQFFGIINLKKKKCTQKSKLHKIFQFSLSQSKKDLGSASGIHNPESGSDPHSTVHNVKNGRKNVPISEKFQYLIGTKPKRVGIFPEFVFMKADCFDMISLMRQFREQTQTFWFHSNQIAERLWNVFGTFVPLLF